MKAHLITFGDGDPRYQHAASRLSAEAANTNWFKSVTAFNFAQLSRLTPGWCRDHQQFISKMRRGFGYWIWKPELIYQVLSGLAENELLVYLDCGCEINRYGYQHFLHICELATRFGFFCYQIDESVSKWTKRLTLNRFQITDEDYSHLNFGQLESGISIYHRSAKTLLFLDLWRKCVIDDEYVYVIDKDDSLVERSEFVEHRHDQSIFTILKILTGVGVHLKTFESQQLLWKNSFYHCEQPFLALRNIYQTSRLADLTPVRSDRLYNSEF